MTAVDLQLFAEEKTERPTPRKRERVRQRGQVPRSQELSSAVVLVCGLVALRMFLPRMADAFQELFWKLWSAFPEVTAGELGWGWVFRTAALGGAAAVWPVMGVGVVAALAVNLAQVGFLFSLHPLAWRLDRLNPFQGAQRLLSRRTVVEGAKALMKMVIVAGVCYGTFRGHLEEMVASAAGAQLGTGVGSVAAVAGAMFTRCAVLLLVLAAADYLFQRYEHEMQLRMTRQELKEEHKETEGLPEVRQRIRQRQRQMARVRMMQQVPRADVVVTNPVHYAVALSYRPERMAAPMVVAKGRQEMARRIVECARRAGVPLVENPPLAQALYRAVEVGALIPPQLYQAVAEILAMVYRMRSGHAREGGEMR